MLSQTTRLTKSLSLNFIRIILQISGNVDIIVVELFQTMQGGIRIIILYHLNQETDLLHFQHGELGATLRASEVKPKLDRFLIRLLGGEEAVKQKHPDWLIGDHLAFDYKMSFIGEGIPTSHDTENKIRSLTERGIGFRSSIPKSYFGNMGRFNRGDIELIRETFKETMHYPNGVNMKIISFNSQLLEYIDEHISAFFLIHNFGTRQNKGFGSFTVDGRNGQPLTRNAQGILLKYSKLFNPRYFYLYAVDYSGLQKVDLMEEARWIYSLLKSGINRGSTRYSRAYIYQYFHNKKIRNEKAWMKQQDIAPIRNRDNVIKQHENDLCRIFSDDNSRYVRALLGLCDRIEYLSDLQNTRIKWPITITAEDTNIKRCASPITFKIVGRKLYILVFEPHTGILGKEFLFEGIDPATSNKCSGRISVPVSNEFNMKELFDGFKNYINANGAAVRNCRAIDAGNFLAGTQNHEIMEVR